MSALKQNTPEWLEMRKSNVGASDAPIIMEVSPYQTPYGLWKEKVTSHTVQKDQNYAMKRGVALEPLARAEFEKQTGIIVYPEVLFHPTHKWMMASLDGIDIEHKNIVEIKCAGKLDHAIAESGNVPEKYYPQLQHQLEVCELEMVYYFSFTGSVGVIVQVYRDDKYIREMLKKEKEFYECMVELSPPKLLTKDYVQKNDDQWIQLASRWKQINQHKEALESEEKVLRESLASLAGDQNAMGSGIRVCKSVRKGNVDYSKVPELIGVDLDQYRKQTSEYWKIMCD